MVRIFVGLAAAIGVAVFGASHAYTVESPRFKAVAFDYFVIFDPNSIVPTVDTVFPGKELAFTRAWRAKLFEYGFLRTITDRHEDFFNVAADALDYTAEAEGFALSTKDKQKLLNAFLTLEPWPDAIAGLTRLKASGVRIITISNLSAQMLRANAEHAGITDLFDALLSTQENATYKPDPRAYALGLERLGLKKEDVAFAAFGGWDAYGAKRFGFPTFWVNRFGLPPERLGLEPDGTSRDFSGLLDFVLN
ncbi:haloacid dehalogenase type II [Hyphomicrobium sp.]|uniref:haloacid dehalogenase type II n=1 Tax=Hyphomicrobium sp. TaxID=82 RepID=UPI002B84ECA7|nr:haloacid dehalogenase type II [Hyphomicrobium sp.]HRN87817.1 haloacid dehalogenase type II [Hyphomicrobium sp.]HRQ26934.1 haloacid dehalogenase type II [Hyphomicrobium sp.]